VPTREAGRPATSVKWHDLAIVLNSTRSVIPPGLDQVRVADIAYVRVAEDFVYLHQRRDTLVHTRTYMLKQAAGYESILGPNRQKGKMIGGRFSASSRKDEQTIFLFF